jgi:hypothetical protein
MIRLKFEDNRYIQLVFPVGGYNVGREKRNIVLISELEVLQLIDYSVIQLEVVHYKTGTSAIYKFSPQFNDQYTGEIQGGLLMRVAVKRILGARQMIYNLPN